VRAEVIHIGLNGPCECRGGDAYQNLSAALGEIGLELGSVTYVRSAEPEVEEALKLAVRRSRLVILTGGVGHNSGREELAKKTLSRLLNRRLILQPDMIKRLEGAYKGRGLDLPHGYEKAALLPHGARPLTDTLGNPSGFYIEQEGHVVLYAASSPEDVMATLPAELPSVMRLRNRSRRFERVRIVRTYGVDELRLAEMLQGVGDREVAVSYIGTPEGVDIRVMVHAGLAEKAESLLDGACNNITAKAGDYCYGMDSEGMEAAVARLLTEKKLTISTAESCTGGLVAKRLTDVSGSSAYMERGVVTYSSRAKEELLDVPAKTLAEHGAVSKETAEAMAEGIRWRANTDLGLSITGIAGPTGGTVAKPVGLVYIGLATSEGVTVKGYNFQGDRAAVRFATSQRALDMVRRYLIS